MREGNGRKVFAAAIFLVFLAFFLFIQANRTKII